MRSSFQEILGMALREFAPGVVSVTMFGSQVKGDARTDSDYDMIIIMDQLDPNPNIREHFVSSAIANVLLTSGARVSPIVITREEATREAESGSPLFATVLSNYEILHDPTGFMAELLDHVKRTRTSLTYVERGRAWDLAKTV